MKESLKESLKMYEKAKEDLNFCIELHSIEWRIALVFAINLIPMCTFASFALNGIALLYLWLCAFLILGFLLTTIARIALSIQCNLALRRCVRCYLMNEGQSSADADCEPEQRA